MSPLNTSSFFDAALAGQPLMGVFRNMEPDAAVARATRAWDAGVRNVEIPIQTRDALPTLRAVVDAGRERGLDVGAGTIIDVEQFDDVAAAGATYTVSPGWDADIVRHAAERNLPHLPGVATASEILAAHRAGLTWVKAFPASVLGESWIRAMGGPFPGVNFVATGGMKLESAFRYLSAGVKTVALGDAFDDPASLARVSELMRGGG
jgi:2-dehydro-3-deoxyphosphogluconate aldolase/(4S)-4-hydroxy-2-oxoglutarate aldolase